MPKIVNSFHCKLTVAYLLKGMLYVIPWHFCVEGIWEKDNLASKLESRIMTRSSLPMMMPVVNCRRKRETSIDTSRCSALESVLSFAQEAVAFLEFVVLMRGKRSEEMGYGERRTVLCAAGSMLVVCNIRLASIFRV